MPELPDRARCVIIGGGVAGTSIAYHLAELGYRDVVLVDRRELTSGSTFHSAGLVGQLRSSVSLTRMMMYSVELYRKLGGGEFDPGWTECGGIRLACTPERWEETRRQAGWAKTFGLPLELIKQDQPVKQNMANCWQRGDRRHRRGRRRDPDRPGAALRRGLPAGHPGRDQRRRAGLQLPPRRQARRQAAGRG